ncbi:MAG TPA: hemolysin family protein, partial [Thermodesulfobacteriota bacterium]|nr:hemolysin family protein [Thermodesulfobacteriota bacterium]
MSFVVTLAIIIGIFLFCEAFLSGSEIAMVAADRKKLIRISRSGTASEKLTFNILQEPSWFLSTTLVGSNLAQVTNAVLVTSILIGHFGARGDFYSFLLLTPLVLILGEVFPKTLFQQKADRWVVRIVPVIYVASLVLYPLVWFMSRSTRAISRFLNQEGAARPMVTREELQLLLREQGKGSDINPLERELIRRFFRFSTTKVRRAMIPLVDVVAVEENVTIGDAIASVRQENYSRYPVYRDRVDNIVGILYSLDLLHARGEEGTIRPFVRPISYFPETKPVDELLIELQKSRETMAAVVDEYGGTVGIVTVEDILEEVVGEIEDEYDEGRLYYRKVAPGKFWVNARMQVDPLNEILNLGLPRGDYETVGGFVLEQLGRVPLTGEVF